MMLHTKYNSTRPCGFRQEDFFNVFLCKRFDSGAEPFLAPGVEFEQTW